MKTALFLLSFVSSLSFAAPVPTPKTSIRCHFSINTNAHAGGVFFSVNSDETSPAQATEKTLAHFKATVETITGQIQKVSIEDLKLGVIATTSLSLDSVKDVEIKNKASEESASLSCGVEFPLFPGAQVQ